MKTYNNNLLNLIQADIEDYLLKSHINADKSRHRTFLLTYFITYILNGFMRDNFREFEKVEHTYNDYLHFIVSAYKARLGHSSVRTTERYTHSTEEAQRKAMDILDSYSKDRNKDKNKEV